MWELKMLLSNICSIAQKDYNYALHIRFTDYFERLATIMNKLKYTAKFAMSIYNVGCSLTVSS